MGKLEEPIANLKFTDDGLIPAICVDAETKSVLMMAWMSPASPLDTIRTGKTHFWSRSRQKYWMKGESSGHTQEVRAIFTDCDRDTVVIEVVQHGAACHDGYFSCFYRRLGDDGRWQVVLEKVFNPDDVYKGGE